MPSSSAASTGGAGDAQLSKQSLPLLSKRLPVGIEERGRRASSACMASMAAEMPVPGLQTSA